jgi:hypothetical protein
VIPSVRGVELFLTAYGFGHVSIDDFLSSQCVIDDFAGMAIPGRAKRKWGKLVIGFNAYKYQQIHGQFVSFFPYLPGC